MARSACRKTSPVKTSLWTGIDFFAWTRLLVRNRFDVDWAKVPLVVFISTIAFCNTILRWLEKLRYGRAVRKVAVAEDPVFIIGHWRTGTTMLHELLSLDPQNRCPSTLECLSPNHFLLSARLIRRFVRWILPKNRPFDNMRMSFDRPQEDEAALCLYGQPSPFLTVAFPRRPEMDPEYACLEGLSERQLLAWKTRLREFLQRLLFQRRGRLILKSPQHTFRLPMLIEMFPQAKFIHIVRDPYVIYPSTVHFWKTMYEKYGLQSYDAEMVHERVLSTFEQMHARLEATRGLVDEARFCELKYEELTNDPVGQMQRLYEALDFGEFAAVRPALERFAERSQRYQTNTYELEAAHRDAISERWSSVIKKYGY